ncbi:MAG: response regulator [Nitrospirae bacterium]|nr:response regulator [Nitrospirota bacterium]
MTSAAAASLGAIVPSLRARKPLRVLLLEDSEDDAHFCVEWLRRAGFAPEAIRAETEKDYLAKLSPDLDVILADYRLPGFDGLRALDLLKEKGLRVPLILVSGAVGEDLAASAIRHGAYDYVLKDRLEKLGQSVRMAIEHRHLTEEKERVTDALGKSENHYKRAFRKASTAERALRRVSRELIHVQEEERKRISRELHDGLGQVLTGVDLGLERLKKAAGRLDGNMGKIVVLQNAVREGLESIHRIAHGLRPELLDHMSLAPALRAVARQVSAMSGVRVRVRSSGAARRLSRETETTLLRVVQEALTNVMKHAKAHEARLTLDVWPREAILTVADDGRNGRYSKGGKRVRLGGGLGIVGIEERVTLAGGKALWIRRPGGGRSLRVTVPVRSPQPAETKRRRKP